MLPYRAFSCDVMLSSNMAASIATESNIHLCKHLFTLLCVTVSPWTSPFVVQGAWWSLHRACMVRVTALDILVSLRNPTPMLDYSMTSVKSWKRSISILLDTFAVCVDGGYLCIDLAFYHEMECHKGFVMKYAHFSNSIRHQYMTFIMSKRMWPHNFQLRARRALLFKDVPLWTRRQGSTLALTRLPGASKNSHVGQVKYQSVQIYLPNRASQNLIIKCGNIPKL